LSVLNVSLDGPNEETHTALRGKRENFKIVQKAIREAKVNGLRVNVLSMLTNDAVNQVLETVDACASLGADEVSFKVIKRVGNATLHPELIPNPRTLRGALQRLLEVRMNREDIQISLGEGSEPLVDVLLSELGDKYRRKELSTHQGCNCGHTSLCIKPNGDITACSYVTEAIGNIRQRSLPDIWLNRRSLDSFFARKEAFAPSSCDDCSEHLRCGGGCYAQSHQSRGQLTTSAQADPNCWRVPDPASQQSDPDLRILS
jgi:AdoMet-dependent heme synthase